MKRRLRDGYTDYSGVMEFVVLTVLRISILTFSVLLVIKYRSVDIDGVVTTFDLCVSVTEPGQYTVLSDTELICDTDTVYYMVEQMKEEGYDLSVVSMDKFTLEVVLENDDYVHHIRYVSTGKLTCISSPYEKSYIPLTYIYERGID